MSVGRDHVEAIQRLLSEAQTGLASLAQVIDAQDVLLSSRETEAMQEPAEPAPIGDADPLLSVMTDPKEFFDAVRKGKLLGPTLTTGEVTGCVAILQACAGWPLAYAADALGTAYLETAGTMQPIKEYGGNAYFARMYDPKGNRPAVAKRLGNTVPGDGVKFPGRGYVQLTGRANYLKATTALQGSFPGLDLIAKPDDALRPDVAAAIMRRGMEEGWFTGKKLADYLPSSGKATREQFKQSRRIINGTDRWEDLATYCLHFQDALVAAGWRT